MSAVFGHRQTQLELPEIAWEEKAPRQHGGLQEIIDARQFPGTKVDGGNDTFFQHRHHGQDLDKMLPFIRDRLLAEAKAAGVSIAGKIYVDGLAKYPQDPAGWVASTEEAKEKAQAQGKHLSGAINFSPDPRKVTEEPEY